ncbi:MAG: Anthranilate phosphoribosyltransferase [Gammaproteobacteria bacterium]|nr:Anthranilate phosphoribosyltransferase [Gammaproteobacteria bacterium]
MTIQQAIQAISDRRDLTANEMTAVMTQIMTGEATPAQIGGFLIGLRMKGETIEEIAAAAAVMRSLSARVTVDVPHLVDTCGTGGDASKIFNISTACAFVCAAAGAQVAKHGNRSVSSSSGSADLLEEAGARLDLSPEQVGACIADVGIGFLFAPAHHSAMKHAIGPRREMAVRTIFNVLGPLTNPAGAPNQLLGVFTGELVEPMARALQQLGSRHVLVVHSDDGLDEISIAAPTRMAELRNGHVETWILNPDEHDVRYDSLHGLSVDSAAASLRLINRVFEGEQGAARDMVVLNAGAAIYTSGIVETLEAGVQCARKAIDAGGARHKLKQFVEYTQSL